MKRPILVALAATLSVSMVAAAPAGAQDGNIMAPAADLEAQLRSMPFEIIDLRGSRGEGDRTQRVALEFEDGAVHLAKLALAPEGGEEFNNRPRYEIAAYEFQKMFLDEPDYVVPPTVVRAFPLEWIRETVDPEAKPTFRDTESVLCVLQYWLFSVTEEKVFNEKRMKSDPAYARHLAHANLFSHLVAHRDANVGNFLVSTIEANPRIFGVDNGHAFGLEETDKGDFWRRLRVDRVPAGAVERLRAIQREDLERELGVIAQFEVVDDQLVPVEPTENLNDREGTRVKDGVVQLGLASDEIVRLHDRIRYLVGQVDRGELETMPEPAPEPAPEQASGPAPPE